MFVRALLAFLALPGIVAFAVPIGWLWASQARLVHPLGLIPLVLGVVALLWCVRDFYVRGKGTLAPWAPPQRLVTAGLYRWSRNPMYVAVFSIVLGWALAYASLTLGLYAALVAVAFHLRVVRVEEPWLAQAHGAEWTDFAQRVPRWLW